MGGLKASRQGDAGQPQGWVYAFSESPIGIGRSSYETPVFAPSLIVQLRKQGQAAPET